MPPLFSVRAFASSCLLLLAFAFASPAQAATFHVTSTADVGDTVPGDGFCLIPNGLCSLRAAVQEANALAGPDVIMLPNGTYQLTLPGNADDGGGVGDLDVLGDLTISGTWIGSTVIDAGDLDRVIDHRSGTLRLQRLTLRNGTASSGAALRSLAAGLIIEDVVIRDSQALQAGGGLELQRGAEISRVTITGNTSGTYGGGIVADVPAGSTLTLTNVTISGNSASIAGGGIAVNSAGTGAAVTATHATLHNNTATAGRSIFVNAGAAMAIRNSIVSAPGLNCEGTLQDAGGNIAASACGSVPVNATLTVSIEPLALYHPMLAGPVLVHPIRTNSPALDSANAAFCVATDQRGAGRPFGAGCDIGAFEYNPNFGSFLPTNTGLTLSQVADQVIRVNTSTAPLLVTATNSPAAQTGGVELTAASSNETLVPPTGIRVQATGPGFWLVRVLPVSNRTGNTQITLTAVSAVTNETAIRVFNVSVRGADGELGGGTPTAGVGAPPTGLVATASGSGVVLTWQASAAAGVRQYVVAGGRSSGGTSLPTLVTQGTETTMTLPALPAGSYHFRVHAVGENGLTAASNEASVTAGSDQAPGTPYGITATALPGQVEITGRGPQAGAAPTSYIVDFGTRPGAADVLSVSPSAAPFRQALGDGFYWVQARAARGAAVGVPSAHFGVLVGGVAPCVEPPHAPVLLPATVNGGTVTLTWLRPVTGPVPRVFVVERLSGIDGLPLETLALGDQSTTYVSDRAAGTYVFRVAGQNSCGTGSLSNQAVVTVGGPQ